MLDDANIFIQKDTNGALVVAASQYRQVTFNPVVNNVKNPVPQVNKLMVTGMGGSALAALLLRSWLKHEIRIPFEIIRGYDLPAAISPDTLVVASSYSGNTEETISCYNQAISAGAQVAILASGGRLVDIAKENLIPYAELPGGMQPRMAVFNNLCALVKLLGEYGIVDKSKMDELASASEWLHSESAKWGSDVPTNQNLAKQLAHLALGKTAVFYGGALSSPVAYKWKISWNENAKNVAFWDELPEFNHNEFIGWTSHPVEKPFMIVDLISNFENPRILKRFEVSDKLLSGLRPKATELHLQGDTLLKQLLWGSLLADYTSIYLAILNNVNPTPVELIEKLKHELASA